MFIAKGRKKYRFLFLYSKNACLHLHSIADKVNAKVAQLVERDLAKVEVAGSNPVFRSNTLPKAATCSRFSGF